MVYDGSPMKNMATLHRQDGGRLTLEDNLATPTSAEGIVTMGKYNASAPTYADGDVGFFQLTSDGRLMTDTNITVTNLDVQLGGVEIKDATTDTRAVVKSDGTNNALVVTMNALPTLATGSNTIGDVTVSSLPALATGTATIGSVKITDGALVLPIAVDGVGAKTYGIQVMGTDGTNSQTLKTDTSGELQVDVFQATASNLNCTEASAANILTAVQLIDDTVYVDDADWADGSSKHLLVGGLYQSTPQTVTDGDVAPFEIDVNGKIIESNSAAIKTAVEIMDDWDDTNYCNVNMNVAGTDVAANAGAMSGQTLRVTIATDDTHTGAVGAASDVDGVIHGQLRYIGEADLAIQTAVQIMDDWDNGASDGASVSGDTAHDAADAGEPVKIGGKASSTVPTAVSATADRVNAYFDMNGYLMVGIGDGVDRALVDGSGNLMVSLGTEIAGEDVTNDVLMVGGKIAHDAAIANVNPVFIGAEAADFDGVALPNAVSAELDAVRLKASLSGVLYVMPLSEDGSGIANIKLQNSASDVVTGISGTYDTLDVSISDGTERLAIDASGNIAVTQSGTWNVGTVTTVTGVTTVSTVTTVTNPIFLKNAAADTVTGISGTFDTVDVSITDGTERLQIDASGFLTANINGTVTVDLGANNDVGINAGTNAIGKLLPPDIDVTAHTNYIRKYYAGTGAVTDAIVWSPAAGKRWHVVSLYVQTSAAATITLEDDKAAGDDPVWAGAFAANQGMTINFSELYPFCSGEDAADLILTTSAGNSVVVLTGYEI